MRIQISLHLVRSVLGFLALSVFFMEQTLHLASLSIVLGIYNQHVCSLEQVLLLVLMSDKSEIVVLGQQGRTTLEWFILSEIIASYSYSCLKDSYLPFSSS